MLLDLKEIVITGIFKDNHDEIEYDGEYETFEYYVDDKLVLKCWKEFKESDDYELDDLDVIVYDDEFDKFLNEYNDYLVERGKRYE